MGCLNCSRSAFPFDRERTVAQKDETFWGYLSNLALESHIPDPPLGTLSFFWDVHLEPDFHSWPGLHGTWTCMCIRMTREAP